MSSTSNSTREEIVFKPRDPLRIRLSVYLYPIGIAARVFFIILAIISRYVYPNAIYALIFAFTVFSLPMFVFRESCFGEANPIKR